MVHGHWRVSELEFYSDVDCSQRLSVSRTSGYVSPLPKGHGPLQQHIEERAVDGNLNTMYEAECASHGGCKEGTVVVGAIVGDESSSPVKCVIVLQPMSGEVDPSLSPTARRSSNRKLRPSSRVSCPGICRSGRYLEGASDGDGICSACISSHGWCGSGPSYCSSGFDCSGCEPSPGAKWDEALSSVDREERSGGQVIAWRLRDTSGWGLWKQTLN